MIKTKNNLLFFLILLILCLISVYYVIRSSACCDYWWISVGEIRYLKEDVVPLIDVTGPGAISRWIIANMLRPYYLLFGSDQYILAKKIADHVIKAVFAVLLWNRVRKSCPGENGVIAGAAFFLFLPAYLYAFLSHYTLNYNLVLLAILILWDLDRHPAILSTLAGIVSAVQILILPHTIFLIPVYLFVLLRRLPKKKLVLLYLAAGISIGLLFILYLLSQGGALSDLLNVLDDYRHTNATRINVILRGVRALGIFALVVVIFQKLAEKLRFSRYSFEILLGLLWIIGIALALFKRDGMFIMRVQYAVVIICGIWALFFGRKYMKKEFHAPFFLFQVFGTALALIVGSFTDTGAMVTAMGFVFPLIGYLCFAEQEGKHILGSAMVILLLLAERMIIIDGYPYCTGFQCTWQIKDGPMAGLWVGEENYKNYYFTWDHLTKECTEEDHILIFCQGDIQCTGYAMTEASSDTIRHVIMGNTLTEGYDEWLMPYWEENPEKTPTKIFIFYEEEIDKILSGRGGEDFARFLEEEYTVKDRETDYLELVWNGGSDSAQGS